MKKLLSLIAAVLIITACSNQEDANSSQQLPVKHTSSIRSFDEALQIAQSSISILEGSDITRSGSTRKINLNDSKVYKLDALTRSLASVNDTLMYVFNFEDDQGFVMVAAPQNVEGLLAITESGHYEPGETTEVEGFNEFTEAIESYLIDVANSQSEFLTDIMERIVYTGNHTPVVGPYVPVEWGQRYPEGEFCPNGICGCTNTAMAQIMSSFGYPTIINLTYEGHSANSIVLDWAKMVNHSTEHTLTNCPFLTKQEHAAIGYLCRQLGELNNSTYHYATDSTSAGTSTYTMSYAIPTFSSLGYSTGTWDNIDNTNIKSELANGHLLLTRGTNTLSNSGHAWVVDGYTNAEYNMYVYHRENNGIPNPWVLYEIIGPEYTTLYHVNWGWYGKNNGYFAYGVFNTSSVIIPDTNDNSVFRNYANTLRFLPVYR